LANTGRTVRVAIAGAALLPLLVCKAPAGSALMKLPGIAAVTRTVTVQEPRAGIDPPVNVTVELPVTAPPHVLAAPPATTKGAVDLAELAKLRQAQN
jgi:hypothetical protein